MLKSSDVGVVTTQSVDMSKKVPDTFAHAIPTTVLTTADSLEEIEDWLLSRNPKALEDLRGLRRRHLAGKTIPLDEAEKKWRSWLRPDRLTGLVEQFQPRLALDHTQSGADLAGLILQGQSRPVLDHDQ
jgi:hypothetical protein